MTLARTLAFVSLLVVAGCSGVETALNEIAEAASADALTELWAGLPEAAPSEATCSGTFGTYYRFGARDLACHGAAALAPATLVGRAPVRPFLSGPHTATGQSVRLDLNAGRAFGRYDPAFVRWVTAAAVSNNATARQFVQPVYRAHVARSARIFWLAYRGLASEGFPRTLPRGPLAEYGAFLEGGPVTDAIEGFEGGESISTYRLIDSAPPLLPAGEVLIEGADAGGTVRPLTYEDWEVREASSTALAFWIRRKADGTQDEWHAGLRGLLAAYDAAWLAAHPG